MPFCSECGAFVFEDTKFCGECGAKSVPKEAISSSKFQKESDTLDTNLTIDEKIQKKRQENTSSMLNAACDAQGLDMQPDLPEDRPCTACGEQLKMTEKHVNAEGGIYHQHCFKCATCDSLLDYSTSYQVEGKFYCVKHGGRNLDPCAGCGGKINGQELDACGTHWHPECFTCTKCNLDLSNKPFREHLNKPYCKLDYHLLFPEKAAKEDAAENPYSCEKCKQPIRGDRVEKDGATFHKQCFEEFKEATAKECSKCNKPCSVWIEVEGAFFHAECWKCYNCEEQLKLGEAGIKKGKYWCNLCIADPFRDC